ncbi:response regulator [Candidatus Saccharibacteria bacterium]|nr:response regulator [Candidatus Saccharibacteria bacterium]
MNKKMTILIAEDEKALRNILRDFLQDNQFLTLEAENGEEAVQLALTKHPDLILLDLMMPIMGGMDALKKIREDSWGQNIPVIILTNLNATDGQLVEDIVEQSPSYYLIKSDWKIKDVVIKIKQILTA